MALDKPLGVHQEYMDSERGPVDGEAGSYTAAGCSAVGVDVFTLCLANRPLDQGIDLSVKDRKKQGKNTNIDIKIKQKFGVFHGEQWQGTMRRKIIATVGSPYVCLGIFRSLITKRPIPGRSAGGVSITPPH